MKPRLWPYLIKQAFANIKNNGLVHLIGLGTMVVSLLIFGTFLLLFVNLNAWIEGWGDSVSMSIYLEDGADDRAVEKIATYIESLPSARIKNRISKREALEELRKSLGSQAGLLEGLSRNPLPASLEVVFEDVEGRTIEFKSVKQELEKMEGVEEAQYSEEWLRRFEGLINIVKLVGYVVGGLLCVGVLFIVTNTIKLTIYSRKEEIKILKLVGATDLFVKIPFLLEGMFHGIVSGVSSVLALFLGYLLVSGKKIQILDLPFLDVIFIPGEYVFAMILISVALGLVGSFVAVGSFFEI
ncbi:MAG: permease-like cell division protein FtsX [Desulfatiglans sp.]|jgi:cell division transport system permease protein|nr:permease-like cell division protein FtsX [Thermodesulfobacteriota bacterium]MEE4351944.1 permease-like cell division protein FtsX [Desulfatiglans sp.]